MFWGWSRPGSSQVTNMLPTIVAGITRIFSDVVDEYRSPEIDSDMKSRELVENG